MKWAFTEQQFHLIKKNFDIHSNLKQDVWFVYAIYCLTFVVPANNTVEKLIAINDLVCIRIGTIQRPHQYHLYCHYAKFEENSGETPKNVPL